MTPALRALKARRPSIEVKFVVVPGVEARRTVKAWRQAVVSRRPGPKSRLVRPVHAVLLDAATPDSWSRAAGISLRGIDPIHRRRVCTSSCKGAVT